MPRPHTYIFEPDESLHSRQPHRGWASHIIDRGTVSNTGLALHRLGVATRLIGKVGDDLFGHATLTIVEQHGAGLANHMLVSPESVVITGSSFRAHGRRREAAAAGTAGEVLGNISADGAEP